MAITMAQLYEERKTLSDEADKIFADSEKDERRNTEEEKARLKAIDAELKNINEDIELRAKHLEHGKKMAIADWNDTSAADVVKQPEKPQGFTGPLAFGEMLQAVMKADMSGGRHVDPRLGQMDVFGAASGMSSEVPSDGGFLVQKDMSSEIWGRVYEQGQIISRTRRVRIGPNSDGLKLNAIRETSRATGSRLGAVRGYWVSQGDQITASEIKFRQIELNLKKLGALVYATDELVKDAAALQSIVMQSLPEELIFLAEDAIFNGTGGGMPTGILNSGAVLSISKETGQPAATIVYENIVKMWARMWGRSRMNSIWAHDQSIEPQLYTMSLPVGTGGNAVFMPAGGASAAPFATLFNRPLVPMEYGKAVGTAGDIQLVDLSQYITIDKQAVESAASMHVRFIYDEMTFRFIYRIDGCSLWDEPLTPKSAGDTLSPFINIAVRE